MLGCEPQLTIGVDGLTCLMVEIRSTAVFLKWMRGLRDLRARARIQVRIDRLSLGNPGDARPIGEGVSEMRIDYGPGYRVYFASRGRAIVALLCGGDKQTQNDDIARAKALAKEWNDGA
jgi:putative addiction module killer protein